MPNGKNPFLNKPTLPVKTHLPPPLYQDNTLQKHLADIIYNKIVPSIQQKDKVIVDNNSIMDQIIARWKKEHGNIKQESTKTKQQQQLELAQSNLDSSLSILHSHRTQEQYLQTSQKQSPTIAKYKKQIIHSPELVKLQVKTSPIHPKENDAVIIQTAVLEPNQQALAIMEQQLNQIQQNNPEITPYIKSMKKKLAELKSLQRSNSNKLKKKSPVRVLDAQPVFNDIRRQNVPKQHEDFVVAPLIEKPPAESAIENPGIELLPENSFTESSFSTVSARRFVRPDYNEFAVKKVKHHPIEITEETRESLSSGMQQVQAINRIEEQAIKMLEAEKNQPEVQLPAQVEALRDLKSPYDNSVQESPATQSPRTRGDILDVVREVVDDVLRGYILTPREKLYDTAQPQQNVEYIEMEMSPEICPQEAIKIHEIPVNEVCDSKVLVEQLSSVSTGSVDKRPVNRSGRRQQLQDDLQDISEFQENQKHTPTYKDDFLISKNTSEPVVGQTTEHKLDESDSQVISGPEVQLSPERRIISEQEGQDLVPQQFDIIPKQDDQQNNAQQENVISAPSNVIEVCFSTQNVSKDFAEKQNKTNIPVRRRKLARGPAEAAKTSPGPRCKEQVLEPSTDIKKSICEPQQDQVYQINQQNTEQPLQQISEQTSQKFIQEPTQQSLQDNQEVQKQTQEQAYDDNINKSLETPPIEQTVVKSTLNQPITTETNATIQKNTESPQIGSPVQQPGDISRPRGYGSVTVQKTRRTTPDFEKARDTESDAFYVSDSLCKRIELKNISQMLQKGFSDGQEPHFVRYDAPIVAYLLERIGLISPGEDPSNVWSQNVKSSKKDVSMLLEDTESLYSQIVARPRIERAVRAAVSAVHVESRLQNINIIQHCETVATTIMDDICTEVSQIIVNTVQP